MIAYLNFVVNMSKSITTIYIESDILNFAKQTHINISKECEEHLKRIMRKSDDSISSKDIAECIANLENDYIKINEALPILKLKLQNVLLKQSEFENTMSMPELQNLNNDQLKNVKLLGDICNIIKDRYNINVEAWQIRKYYKQKGLLND